ncbi:Rab proteins geranylgeranyltransferase component A [Elasticomyces elasticus]|nr:Rab proteins geranylgeranyltransferase component A [Elasticomyces elasticus]
MESLDGTNWDVVIADRNAYYGGAEAAFSLQEAEEWVEKVEKQGGVDTYFSHASIRKSLEHTGEKAGLGPSRAYTLSLSPNLIYTRSALLPVLVSSRCTANEQLSFQAVGSWFVHSGLAVPGDNDTSTTHIDSRLLRVPNGREDVFADTTLDLRTKRSLMKFLRFVGEYESQPEIWEEHRKKAFPAFLLDQFKFPTASHAPLLALTMSPDLPSEASTEFALPRIARHLRSIGLFGAGFGAVIPKFGGLAEITQVASRASAVGGGVNVLRNGAKGVNYKVQQTPTRPREGDAQRNLSEPGSGDAQTALVVQLDGGETVYADWLIGQDADLPLATQKHTIGSKPRRPSVASKSITIVDSPLLSLFPRTPDSSPQPAGAVVVFPSRALSSDQATDTPPETPPVHVVVHSGDTGECPAGQCVLYASTALPASSGLPLLDSAIVALLVSVQEDPKPCILFSMQYQQRSGDTSSVAVAAEDSSAAARVLQFPSPDLDVVFSDDIVSNVETAWKGIMGDDAVDFMRFEVRDGSGGEEDEDEGVS